MGHTEMEAAGMAVTRINTGYLGFFAHFILNLFKRELNDNNGEGSGTPLQCSCLENPRGGGASGAADCGVTQSPTRLKRLSSSSSEILFKKGGLHWLIIFLPSLNFRTLI